MGMSGLPDMYTQSLRAKGVHIRQTTSVHGITVMYHSSFLPGKQKAVQARKLATCKHHCIYRGGCKD